MDVRKKVTYPIASTSGGTGSSTAPSTGQVLIGNTDGTYTPANITAGSNIVVAGGEGTIEISSTAGGAQSGQNADITGLLGLASVIKAPTRIQDTSSQDVVVFGSTPSAVNSLKITNAATGNSPVLEAVGSDTNVTLLLQGQGTGGVKIGGTTSVFSSDNANTALVIAGTGTKGVELDSALSPNVITLNDAATIATDASRGNDFLVTLGGNRVLGQPTNPRNGQRCVWTISQDATGSRLLTYSPAFRFPTDIPSPTLSTAAGTQDKIAAIFTSRGLVARYQSWDVCAVVKGYTS